MRIAGWKWVLGIGLVAVAGYFALPGTAGKDLGYSTIGIASILCVVIAIHLHHPLDRRCWYLIAAGNLCFVLGDGVYDVYQFILHRSIPFPSTADALYLSGYPFLFAGVARLRPRSWPSGARSRYADAAIVSIGALAISWHFLVSSYAHDDTMSTFGKVVTVTYPMMDIAILFVVLRAVLFGGDRLPAHRLLAVSLLSMFTGDFIYDLLVQHGSYATGNPVDSGWLIAYVLVAAGAAHPSVADTSAGSALAVVVERRRLPLVAMAGFAPPVILVISGISGNNSDVAVLAVFSISLFALVIMRMHWLFARLSGQTSKLEVALSERRELEETLRYQAFHDPLTGLANRALLRDRVGHTLANAKRLRGTVALCLCDLDGFKAINDSFGHGAGDDVLIAVAKRLRSIVREGDTVARLGGDEFAVLIDNVEAPEDATAIAERIVVALRQPIELDGRRLDLSGSVGIAVADLLDSTERLLGEADSAMYAAKSAGKNRFELFEQSMLDQVVQQLTLKNAFTDAIERSEFFLQYQPQFSLQDGKLEGFEALLRWQHPTLGVIAPNRFISLAEESGHIVPIGRWILETACEQAAAWTRASGRGINMAVNISSRQLQNPNFVDDVGTALALSGLAPNRLVLEISESSLLLDMELTSRARNELKAIGLKLAIDNFGTGYASLSHLHEYPVDVLKIDRSFIESLGVGNESSALVQMIVALAHTLGLETIAEGVERLEQRDLLADLGCDGIQGYLLAPPLDAGAAAKLIGVPSSVGAGRSETAHRDEIELTPHFSFFAMKNSSHSR